MFQILLNAEQVRDNLFLSTPIYPEQVFDTDMSFFDKDGYELNQLEQLYYAANEVTLNKHLYHVACQHDWLAKQSACSNDGKCGAFVDHSMVLYRYEYVGAARRQLELFAEHRPVLHKLLQVKQKWGLDLSIDWIDDQGALELFHIEIDRYTKEECVAEKQKVEEFVTSEFKNLTHVADAVRQIREYKFQWDHLPSDDQTDWKVRFMSTNKFLRAFDTRKSI